jgi:hypothetical protein
MLLSWICFAIHCSPSPYPTCFTKLDITNLQGRIVDCSVEFTCNIQHFVSCKCTSKSIVNHYSLTQNNFISIISFSFLPLDCLSFRLPFWMPPSTTYNVISWFKILFVVCYAGYAWLSYWYSYVGSLLPRSYGICNKC